MAGHKGYGLAVMVEVLAAVMTGASVTKDVKSWVLDLDQVTDEGHAFIALDVGAMMPPDVFAARMDAMIRSIRSAPKAVGADRIYLPGEKEWEKREEALRDGISLPEETGDTFAANARLKAESVFSAMGGHTAVLADDSGLEVRALDGRPGVHSARFAGPQATDEANVRKLLDELGNRSDREGRFVCCLCLVLPEGVADGTVEGDGARRIEVEGVTDGTIAAAPRGNDGFGYDPVFQVIFFAAFAPASKALGCGPCVRPFG